MDLQRERDANTALGTLAMFAYVAGLISMVFVLWSRSSVAGATFLSLAGLSLAVYAICREKQIDSLAQSQRDHMARSWERVLGEAHRELAVVMQEHFDEKFAILQRRITSMQNSRRHQVPGDLGLSPSPLQFDFPKLNYQNTPVSVVHSGLAESIDKSRVVTESSKEVSTPTKDSDEQLVEGSVGEGGSISVDSGRVREEVRSS